jgi:hypothetical protein
MNALDLLKADHRYVDMLFTRIEGTPPSRHMPIFQKILGEMRAHQHIEERIFYPLLKERGDSELREITMEAFEEHAQMKKFLQEINRASTTKEKREAKLKVLIEDTRHHVKEEEGEMFSMVEDQFSDDELDALGERMEAEKVKFQKSKRILPRKEEAPSTMSVLVEKAKNVVSSMMPGGESESTKDSGSKAGSDGNGSATRSNGSTKTRSKSANKSSRPTAKAARPRAGSSR